MKKIPWLSKEERRRMEIIRTDLRRQAEWAYDNHDTDKARMLEVQITTLNRELAFDLET